MTINDIKFNPYEEPNIEDAIKKFEMSFSHSPNEAYEELANRMFLDNSFDWRLLVNLLFERFTLKEGVTSHFKSLLQDKRVDILPQYTYLITFLISNNLILLKDIDKDTFNQLDYNGFSNSDSKRILFSFLAFWDLDYALEIDQRYVEDNFRHLIDAEKAPIRELISKSEQYHEVLTSMLSDDKIQFHINQTIQRIIKDKVPEELRGLEHFIGKCLKNSNKSEVEFILDALELSSVRNFLLNNWQLKFTENLYSFLSQSLLKMEGNSESFERIATNKINRLKGELSPDFHIAARHEINKLKESDKDFLVKKIEELSSVKINKLSSQTEVLQNANKAWEWFDYANELVINYRKRYIGEESIDIRKLIQDLNFRLIVKKFETEQFDACLVRDSSLISPIIFVNTNKKSKGRINFSIAHELAHAVIPHHSDKSYFCFIGDVSEENKVKMDKNLEFEANSFASNVLLPNKEFKQFISNLDFNLVNVIDTSQKYDVSIVLVAKKWVEQSNLEIAMVFSTNCKVDWTKKSDTFPFGWIDVIPEDSSVHKVINEFDRERAFQNSSSSKWFDSQFEKTIQEESYIIFEDKVLTLLQIIEN